METKQKILLVDDDPDVLDTYQEILKDLPSQPEIDTATTGARALALLESESYRILITDLKMPRMDGLQLLSIVRRKHPDLPTIVLTGVSDEQFRSRVYALGVDMLWQKPTCEREVAMFKDCVQSIIEQELRPGFRGVHSKSLVDIIQLECISQASSVLRITNGPLVGKIWINHGEIYDAEAGNLKAGEAFQHILSWRSGSFEVLPCEPDHPNAIQQSNNALLLESVQAIDEAFGNVSTGTGSTAHLSDPLSQIEGLDFFIAQRPGESAPAETRSIDNPERLAVWTHNTLERFRNIGDRLQTGQPDTVVCMGMRGHIGLTRQDEVEFCIGWRPQLDAAEIRNSTKKASALWAS